MILVVYHKLSPCRFKLHHIIFSLHRDCSPTTKTVLERVCVPKVDKVCKSVIEETTEERCKVKILIMLFTKVDDAIKSI